MLEVIGSVASILGFSMQTYEKYKSRLPGPAGESMGALKVLSETSRTWKDIHLKYHTLSRDIDRIIIATTHFSTGAELARRLGDVRPMELKEACTTPTFNHAVLNFERELKPQINTIRFAHRGANKVKEEVLDDIRQKGKMDVAERLEKVCDSQGHILSVHQRFTAFLSDMKSHVELVDWESSQVEYVLSNRNLLRLDYPSVIYDTDQILMALLDLYNSTIDDVKV